MTPPGDPDGDAMWRRGARAEAPPGTSVVRVADAHRAYRRGSESVQALRGVSLGLREGEIVGLVGPSGSGKTTLLNLLCGWEEPDSGDVTWAEGRNGSAGRGWADVAVLPQGLGLLEELTIRENVEFPVHLAGGDPSGRVDGLVEGLGLGPLADRAPSEVSLGEQQRAALARALVLGPRLLLADEPTAHQDARWGRVAFAAIRAAARRGTSVLVATHNAELAGLADRLLSIRDGRLTGSVPAGAGLG